MAAPASPGFAFAPPAAEVSITGEDVAGVDFTGSCPTSTISERWRQLFLVTEE
jgi:hypothetical protein